MKSILVLSKEQFAELPADDSSVVLRIIDPSDFQKIKESGFTNELVIAFNDVEEPIGHYTPIEPHQARQIISFLLRNAENDRFVMHCNFGQSRSHTCALFFAQEILQDEALASLLASDSGKSINFAVWNALKVAHIDIKHQEKWNKQL